MDAVPPVRLKEESLAGFQSLNQISLRSAQPAQLYVAAYSE